MRSFYSFIVSLGYRFSDFFLLAIRLFWGFSFASSGYGKLANIDPVIDFFTSLHIPFPLFNAYFVGYVELIGGISLILGLGARLMAIPLAIAMTVALSAHVPLFKTAVEHPQKLISQTPFNYFFTSVIIFCFGPGRFSLDHLLKKKFFKKS